MLEKTPGFSRNNSLQENHLTVDLPVITCFPSRCLFVGECVIYCTMAISASIALFPFFLTAFYWPVLWLLFVAAVTWLISGRRKIRNSAEMHLDITHNNWRIRSDGVDKAVAPFDDVLLWSWVIILPLKETITGKKHRVVLLPDSLADEEWRRLRVWLKTCFSK